MTPSQNEDLHPGKIFFQGKISPWERSMWSKLLLSRPFLNSFLNWYRGNFAALAGRPGELQTSAACWVMTGGSVSTYGTCHTEQNARLWSRSAFNFRESFCLFLTAQQHLHAKPAFALIELNVLSNWESKRRDNDLRKSDFGQSCQPHALKQTCHDKTSVYYYNQHNHNRFSCGTTTRRFEFRQKIGTNMRPGKITLNENILT